MEVRWWTSVSVANAAEQPVKWLVWTCMDPQMTIHPEATLFYLFIYLFFIITSIHTEYIYFFTFFLSLPSVSLPLSGPWYYWTFPRLSISRLSYLSISMRSVLRTDDQTTLLPSCQEEPRYYWHWQYAAAPWLDGETLVTVTSRLTRHHRWYFAEVDHELDTNVRFFDYWHFPPWL